MDEHIYPNEHSYHDFVHDSANLWQEWPGMEALKVLAREAGLWNLFLPHEYGAFGPGLTNLEYAPLAEIMGRVPWCSQVFNCSAPDTGNMEVLARFGTPEQQERWLTPLLNGEIRSAYVMTEPQVASSDATNLELTILPDGDDYVLNGRKWWISGARHPRCELFLVMGKTLLHNPRHQQQSTIIVPRDTPGVTIVRHQTVFGSMNSPGGESELKFENVRVPRTNLILGEGRGFEIAQGRLGPGRIHHCMRSIGQAQRALEIMARRAETGWEYGFLPERRHLNIGGVVHGGMLMSFMDDVLGMTVWEAAGRKPVTTVQLNHHFIAPGKHGDLVIGRGEILRTTRSVVFIRGTLTSGDRVLVHADGVWKILGT
jgi:acyl-CoA dehydrogenase